MTYRVILQPRAIAQLDSQFLHIARQNPRAAEDWFNRFVEALETLARFPERCGVARESELVGREVRLFLFGKRSGVRRAYFIIESQTVRILAIRHGAQDDIPLEELANE